MQVHDQGRGFSEGDQRLSADVGDHRGTAPHEPCSFDYRVPDEESTPKDGWPS
jgi:hypothetical protein